MYIVGVRSIDKYMKENKYGMESIVYLYSILSLDIWIYVFEGIEWECGRVEWW